MKTVKAIKLIGALALVLLGHLVAGLALPGCATSEPVILAAPQIINNVAGDATHYAAGDPAKLAQVSALQAQRTNPTTAGIAAAWGALKAWYVPAFQADASLTADELAIRNDQATRLDKLLADDSSRPLAGKVP